MMGEGVEVDWGLIVSNNAHLKALRSELSAGFKAVEGVKKGQRGAVADVGLFSPQARLESKANEFSQGELSSLHNQVFKL